ncbi:MAG: RNA polymerase sigma factor RpoE [Chloroflexota bacterium]
MTLTRQLTLWVSSLSDPDAPLLSKAMRGDRRAFDTLLRQYERLLKGFLARRVGPEAADDVYQETVIASWVGLSDYAGRARFKAWLFGIAGHKCADFHRTRSKNGWMETSEPPDAPDPSNAYESIELRDAVKDLLGRLPDAQREVLELYYYAELTLAEIASALGRNLNTVKYQFYRAHAQAANELRCMGSDAQ